MTEREAFAAEYDVPRGTLQAFDRYAALLADWQTRMNLVGASTLEQIWSRHFADSAQLLPLVGAGHRSWLDIGAGAGFPGLVVALLSEHHITLVDSVTKKCRFLEAAVDALDLGKRVTVRNCRIEALPAFPAQVITARACAPLAQLFDWGGRFARHSTQWLLPKGASVADEIDSARTSFDFAVDLVPSRTDARGRIVVATNVRRGGQRA